MVSNEQNQLVLEQAFEFTPDELALNRAGRLSPAQKAKLAQYRQMRGCGRRAALIAFSLTAVGLAVMPFLVEGPGMEQARPFIWGPAALFFVIALLALLLDYLSGRDLAQGRINVMEGQVKVWSKRVKSHYGNLGAAYYLKVGRKKYQLETANRMQALRDGGPYRFYFVSNGRVPIILSVEALGR